MKRFKAVWMGALLCALPVAALAASLWEGTVGKAAVVVHFDPQRAGDEGAYFYRRHLLDIRLRSADSASASELVEGEEGAHWRMQAPTHEAWRGVWVGSDGRELPISLHALPEPVANADDGARERWITAAYDKQRLRDLGMKAGARETRGSFLVQWWEEPRSKIRSLQVLSGYPEAVRQRINKTLRERQWREVTSYFYCMSAPRGGEFDQTVTLRYIDTDAISLSVFTDYYCGGAHPDFGDNPITLDGRTGEALRLEDVLYLGKGTPPKYEASGDSDAYFKYRGEILAPWLAKTMKQLHPADMPAVGPDSPDCDYNDPSVWQFTSWHLRPDGIYFGPSFARVMRVCEYPEWSVLPWRVVRQHAGRVKLGPAAK